MRASLYRIPSQVGRPHGISHNERPDCQLVSWYIDHFTGDNPLRSDSTNLGSLYTGVVRGAFASFKRLRPTKHTHVSVEDAIGDADGQLNVNKTWGEKVLWT